MVVDAKYKRMEMSILREDLYQLTSYLHVMNSKNAGFIYPSMSVSELEYRGKLKGYGGNIFKIPFNIPQESNTYKDFIEKIALSENSLRDNIEYLIKNNS